jgi:diadenosine tetraphosphate (Ap4A) HIT family hydrolase
MKFSACPFCSPEVVAKAVAYHGTAFALNDLFPVTPGHMLIIPNRHVEDWFTLNDDERRAVETLLLRLRDRFRANDPQITGFNIGMNCGKSAGQTIFHAHIHLIPRRDGDVEDPCGGVRGVIPRRQRR